jgi:hypothetical protein
MAAMTETDVIVATDEEVGDPGQHGGRQLVAFVAKNAPARISHFGQQSRQTEFVGKLFETDNSRGWKR